MGRISTSVAAGFPLLKYHVQNSTPGNPAMSGSMYGLNNPSLQLEAINCAIAAIAFLASKKIGTPLTNKATSWKAARGFPGKSTYSYTVNNMLSYMPHFCPPVT